MIKSILLKYFQSHRKTKLTFSPGVNAIVGKSTTGKTAILRAFELVRTNRPSGSRYRNNKANGKSTVVKIKTTDGQTVIFKKDKKGTYTVNDEAFAAIGTSVPDKVTQTLNISDLNIQRQLDAPFLICSTAGEITRTINKITHLDKCDVWIATLSKQVSATAKEKQSLETSIAIAKTDLEQYKDLDETEKIIARIERTSKKITKLEKESSALHKLIKDNKEVCKATEKKSGVFTRLQQILKEIEIVEQEVIGLATEQDTITAFLAATQNTIGADAILGTLSDLLAIEEEGEELILEFVALTEYCNTEASVYKLQRDAQYALNDYEDGLKELGQCPTCFTIITDDKIRKIAEELT